MGISCGLLFMLLFIPYLVASFYLLRIHNSYMNWRASSPVDRPDGRPSDLLYSKVGRMGYITPVPCWTSKSVGFVGWKAGNDLEQSDEHRVLGNRCFLLVTGSHMFFYCGLIALHSPCSKAPLVASSSPRNLISEVPATKGLWCRAGSGLLFLTSSPFILQKLF